MSWWVDLGYPAFEEGKGGFPRTGQVIRYYRVKKMDEAGHAWTQIRFARHLKISGKAAGDIENKDAGLPDMDRRRHFCELFAIPAFLLGIRTLEQILTRVEEERAEQTASAANPSSASWWQELGYPEFAKGPDGFPHTGQVVKYYRKQKMDKKGHPWTQRLLSQCLGLTEQAVRDMESRGSGMDWDRRQFLSEWLDIPPILLGITTVKELLKSVEGEQTAEPAVVSSTAHHSRSLLIDIQQYTSSLNHYWTGFISDPTPSSTVNVCLSMDALYRELPHVGDERPIQELLCRYHDLVANVLRDRQQYDEAILHCKKALRFAQLLSSNELSALVLYDWGYLLWQAGHLEEAQQKYEQARCYERGLPDHLRSALLLDAGLIGAMMAKNELMRREAIALVDRVGNMLHSTEIKDDPYFLHLNLDGYHLRRSLLLLTLGYNRDALDELQLVKVESPYLRRQAKKDIYQAQARLNLGEYERVVALVETGLEVAQKIGSRSIMAHVEKIYQQLSTSPYKDSPDVGRLDFLLRRMSKK
jgi:tetratricopeptide (TPR) repeat protein